MQQPDNIAQELLKDREKGSARFMAEYRERLYSVALALCHDETEAEDLVLRTLERIIEKIGDYQERDSFYNWACVIMLNLYRDSTRGKVVQGTLPVGGAAEMDALMEPVGAERIVRDVDSGIVRQVLERMPEDMREVLLLHYFMDMPVGKIAKFLAMPVGTIKSRLHYARLALAMRLGAKLKKPAVVLIVAALLLLGATAAVVAVTRTAVDGGAASGDVVPVEDTETGKGTEGIKGTYGMSDAVLGGSFVSGVSGGLDFNLGNEKGAEQMNIKNKAAALVTAAATLGTVSAGAEPLGSSLAAYLTFDDAVVSNRIQNSTITGVTLSNSGIASGVKSGQYGHSGFGGYLDINQGWARLDGSQNLEFENGNNFTICIWMRAEAAPPGDPAFVGNGSWSGTKTPGALLAYYNLGVAANYSFVTNNVADRRRINGTTKTKKWNFYAISHTSDGKFCFYQGNNVDSFITVEDSDPPNSPTFTLVYDAVASRRPFYLGQDGTGTYGYKFTGKLDEFALWTRGLSSSDINAIYQNGRKGHTLDTLLKPGISMSDLGAGNIRLSFDGARTENYELYVGSGSVDCGADRFAWDHFDRIATIAPTDTTYDYALSDGIKNENRYYRFFLTKDADYQEVEYVQNDGNGSGTGSADNSHFVTSIEPTKDTTVATEVEVVSGTTWCEMFGACNSSAKAFYHLAYLWTEKVWDTEILKWPAAGGGTLKFGSLTTGTCYAFDYTVRGVTWWNSSEEGVSSAQTLMSDSVAANFPGVAHGLAVFRCEGVDGNRYDRCFQGKMYSLVISTNGVLASDFIPVKNASGTVGFYEDGAKTFHPSVTDRPFVGGPAVASRLSVQTETVKAIGASDPVTAYWVGGANGAIDDPESWHCENTYGDAIEAVPQAITDISIANAGQMFNVSANASVDCNSITIAASFALAADCDWRGVDLSKVTGAGTVNLAGHKLYLASSANIGNAINITDLTGGGELHVEIPFGSIVENTGLSLAGAATLVKDGDGTLTASCPNQSNTGGAYVNAGTLKTTAYINTGILGASGSPVKVGSCGTLRIDNGYTGLENHPIELGGGVLYVYNSSVMPGRTVIGNMTLTADSTLQLETVVGVGGDSTCDTELDSGTVWNLGGHGLTVLFETSNTDFFAGKEKTVKPVFNNGTIILPSTVGFWQDWGINASNHVSYVYGMVNTRERVDSSTYDFENNIPSWANFIKKADVAGVGTMSVYGTYTPSETNLCFSIRMMNGSTINLGNRTTAMPVSLGYDYYYEDNVLVNIDERTMAFESGATINIEFGSRHLRQNEKVVSWSAIPAGITFVDPSRRWSFVVAEDGLYAVRGLKIIIR